MKFSIVISTYNRLSLLKRSIDSALNQTVPCEVVIADDCSPDDTQTYVESLGEQVIYHRNRVNSGHSATVNAGVAAASGDWIKFVDDDDYLAPNCIEEMSQAIALHPEAVICSCQAAQVDLEEKVLSVTRRSGPGKVFYIPQEDIHYGMLLELVPFGTPIQVACKRDSFIQSEGWDSSLDANCDDINSWLKVAQFGDALFINQTLAYRTVWPGAYNKKNSISKRLETNLLIKSQIYPLVTDKHRQEIPRMAEIESYLNIHWGLAALKQKNVSAAIYMILPNLLSISSWKLLIQSQMYRRNPDRLSIHPIYNKLVNNINNSSLTEGKQNNQNIKTLQARIKIRASQLAWKQGKIILAIKIAFPIFLKPQFWPLLSQAEDSEKPLKFSLNSTQYDDKQSVNLKQKFYRFLQKNDRSSIPELAEVQDYLRLHWGLLALKEGQIKQAYLLIFPSAFSPVAWNIFLNALKDRLGLSSTGKVRKIVLVKS
ncbi:glycosyltransferase family A protein [Roseofilum sp. BLCC_M154]|uniref:Glycosyltransferase family A protein n=1 Tax=Roseofilum acuticapitatum BLCC-M154 TaxID=3022444 RepID=A0ABT7AVI3_9CYAN|nr:glycosyltransferase family A protein [Roseofilum acuticapitatum]MDJ1170078.1 glycosyltransferase family A protein [Roseofilum acuticapitatum BLCC-M154]